MKESYIVDSEGFLVDVVLDDYILKEGHTVVTEPWAEGTYKPKWNGEVWEEGLTADELAEVTNVPSEPSPLDILGAQLVALELENMSLREENQMLGESLVYFDLRLMNLEGGMA